MSAENASNEELLRILSEQLLNASLAGEQQSDFFSGNRAPISHEAPSVYPNQWNWNVAGQFGQFPGQQAHMFPQGHQVSSIDSLFSGPGFGGGGFQQMAAGGQIGGMQYNMENFYDESVHVSQGNDGFVDVNDQSLDNGQNGLLESVPRVDNRSSIGKEGNKNVESPSVDFVEHSPVITPKEERKVVEPIEKPSSMEPKKPKSWAEMAKAASRKSAPPVSKKPSSVEAGSSDGGGDSKGKIVGNRNEINSVHFDCRPRIAKFYVIKSYSEDDIHKSIKYGIWASTDTGNKRLDQGHKTLAGRGPIYLFYSVNASGQFCGVAEMTSSLDFSSSVDCWESDKWNGQFTVVWKFIKDIPNREFRHIRLPNNENKPVTNSRDTQEIPFRYGVEMLDIFSKYPSKSSLMDNFEYHDKKQKEERERQK